VLSFPLLFDCYLVVNSTANYFAAASFLPDCFVVVRALTGDFAFTARASFKTKWLRRIPVARALVRFFGFPMSF
jgi:hypothetical protein